MVPKAFRDHLIKCDVCTASVAKCSIGKILLERESKMESKNNEAFGAPVNNDTFDLTANDAGPEATLRIPSGFYQYRSRNVKIERESDVDVDVRYHNQLTHDQD